ncbi:MAG: hypothetical protein DRH90_26020 [Deltaproteobacteria bacterium]|nr:MAG: hypothetical protein DRH90_26020 [Deltaproteobacteria bacterium]
MIHYQVSPNRRVLLHTHEYAEIALIESGKGIHTINDDTSTLKPGDIFLIRPSDCHTMGASKHGIGLTNLAFPLSHAVNLENRYLPDDLRYFRSDEKLPWSTHLDDESYVQVENLFRNLANAVPEQFELERFLMNLFALLKKPLSALPLGHAPDWLHHACVQMHQPAHLAEGIPALVRFAGRSLAHTARELRKYSGTTPTEFINRLRIEHAAQLLCTTDKSILEIALDCGFENQGHFHRRFKDRFETTPLKYRKKSHSIFF